MDSNGTENVKKVKLTPEEIVAVCVEIADSHKAENIVNLKVGEFTVIADYFVLCTGNSVPHINAIADSIPREMRKRTGYHELRITGSAESKWVIVDFGSVIVHVMSPETRDLYQIENLWGDAPRIESVKVLEKASRAKKKTSK